MENKVEPPLDDGAAALLLLPFRMAAPASPTGRARAEALLVLLARSPPRPPVPPPRPRPPAVPPPRPPLTGGRVAGVACGLVLEPGALAVIEVVLPLGWVVPMTPPSPPPAVFVALASQLRCPPSDRPPSRGGEGRRMPPRILDGAGLDAPALVAYEQQPFSERAGKTQDVGRREIKREVTCSNARSTSLRYAVTGCSA